MAERKIDLADLNATLTLEDATMHQTWPPSASVSVETTDATVHQAWLPSGSLSVDPVVTSLHHCHLVEFAVDTLLTGTFCLFGFMANTLAFLLLWALPRSTATTVLLQAVIVADYVIVWMLFLGDCVPGLAYAVSTLQNCVAVCAYIRAVTQPLLLLAQTCVIWLTLLVVANKYIMLYRPGHAGRISSLEYARKQILVTVITAIILTIPYTLDTSVKVTVTHGNYLANHTLSHNSQRASQVLADSKLSSNPTAAVSMENLADSYWYRVVYIHGITFGLGYVIPLATLLYFSCSLTLAARSMRRACRSLPANPKAEHNHMTQVILTLGVMVWICYLPQVALYAVSLSEVIQGTWTHKPPCGSLLFYLDSFSKMFMAVNSSTKIILLCLFMSPFRRRLCHACTCHCESISKKTNKLIASETCHGRLYECVDTSDSINNAMYKHGNQSDHTIYRCGDMSEMTLISDVDPHSVEY